MSNGDYLHFKFNLESIRNHIIFLRESKGWSSYKLALNSDMRTSVLRRIEKGERQPSLDTILKIIDGLEMTPAEFFKGLE